MINYGDRIADARRRAGGDAGLADSIASDLATAATAGPRRAPAADDEHEPAPGSPAGAVAAPQPVQGQSSSERGQELVPPVPAPTRAKPDRQGIDFRAGRLDTIKDAVRMLERRGVKSGAKIGPSVVVGALVDEFLPLWQSDPDRFEQIVRRFLQAQDKPVTQRSR